MRTRLRGQQKKPKDEMRRVFLGVLTLLLLLGGASPSHAQTAGPDAATVHAAASDTAAQPPGPTDPAEMEAFLDGLVEGLLEAHDIAGGVVAVVRGDSVAFQGVRLRRR